MRCSSGTGDSVTSFLCLRILELDDKRDGSIFSDCLNHSNVFSTVENTNVIRGYKPCNIKPILRILWNGPRTVYRIVSRSRPDQGGEQLISETPWFKQGKELPINLGRHPLIVICIGWKGLTCKSLKIGRHQAPSSEGLPSQTEVRLESMRTIFNPYHMS